MDSSVTLISDTPFRNVFTYACVGVLAAWGAAIAFRKQVYSTPIEQRDKNKRYMINSQTKLNNDIKYLNRNKMNIPKLVPNFFGRHQRFNKFK